MKKVGLKLLIPVALLLSASVVAFCVKVAQANPYMYHEWVDPPSGSIPLAITIASPVNNTSYNCSDVAFKLNITTQGTSVIYLLDAYYTTSWKSGNVTVYKQNSYSPEFPSFWEYSDTFRQMPDGEYTVMITARGGGGYAEGLTYNFFDMTKTSVIKFRVDTNRPCVSQLSIENKTYSKPDLSLDFVVNESVSVVSYVLDGQKNVSIYGNTTLTGLPEGVHNVTVYATDAAGNVGVSETAVFSVSFEKPFQVEPMVAGVAVATAAVILVAGLAYFKKRRR